MSATTEPATTEPFFELPIDAVFLDREHRVVGNERDVRPWRATGRRGSYAVLELPSGECERRELAVGDRLVSA